MLLGRRLLETDALLLQVGLDQTVRVAAEQNVHATARHVGGDGDRARPSRLGDHPRLTLVLLGVQHLVGHASALQQLVKVLRLFDRRGAQQHRPPAGIQLCDLLDHRVELGVLRLVDEVGLIGANHRSVRRNDHDIEVVDLLELLPLRPGCAGHSRQLLVHTEVVLEGDTRQGDVFPLNVNPFLGFDRLMQALRVPPPWHQSTSELVDDDDLTVRIDDVLIVAMEQELRLERVIQIVREDGVLGIVDAAGEVRVHLMQH